MLNALEIAGMRSTSASALPDTCTITRPDGPDVFDADTGLYEPGPIETVYTGAVRVRERDSQEIETQVGDLHEILGRYVATLPHTVDGPNVDDFLTVTASIDADLIGRSFRVVHVGWGSWQIDRRLGLEDRESRPVGGGS